MLTLCSLFDGSGGFPLAGSLCGIEPVCAAEIEPYPIAVTTSRFPLMEHLGSVTEISGAEIEPVDIITFGSPCQDLSVAGKRAGLKHEDNGDDETTRSGLFMEAVRIIKEMREKTNGEYPKYAIWENVPGAFSSNKGDDFRVVLEELIKIVEPTAKMPPCGKNGWPYADCYMGAGWSLAYRTFDAQYWGVPQRRRRIHLILDLRGERAHKVLFEREGLRGYFAEGRTPWQGSAEDAENCVGAADREGHGGLAYTLKIRSGCEGCGKGALVQTDKSATLSTLNDQYLFQPVSEMVLDDQGGQQMSVRTDGKAPTLRAEMHGNVPCVIESAGFCPEQSAKTRGFGLEKENSPTLRAGVVPGVAYTLEPGIAAREGGHIYDGVSGTLRANAGDNQMAVAYSIENHPADSRVDIDESGKVQTLTSRMGTGGGNVPMVREPKAAYWDGSQVCGTLTANNANGAQRMPDKENFNCVIAIDRAFFNQGQNAQYDPQLYTDGTNPTLVARGPNAVAVRYIVRRLTPTECARLQGFPDRWGGIDPKEALTPGEYRFWHKVRNTHEVVNGKPARVYNEKQMLAWYNKLHTDSAEYKMWGNGIALPCALYVMQGIVEAEVRADGQ